MTHAILLILSVISPGALAQASSNDAVTNYAKCYRAIHLIEPADHDPKRNPHMLFGANDGGSDHYDGKAVLAPGTGRYQGKILVISKGKIYSVETSPILGNPCPGREASIEIDGVSYEMTLSSSYWPRTKKEETWIKGKSCTDIQKKIPEAVQLFVSVAKSVRSKTMPEAAGMEVLPDFRRVILARLPQILWAQENARNVCKSLSQPGREGCTQETLAKHGEPFRNEELVQALGACQLKEDAEINAAASKMIQTIKTRPEISEANLKTNSQPASTGPASESAR
jgi:hypothetical protein